VVYKVDQLTRRLADFAKIVEASPLSMAVPTSWIAEMINPRTAESAVQHK
jgi:hypothetical protein